MPKANPLEARGIGDERGRDEDPLPFGAGKREAQEHLVTYKNRSSEQRSLKTHTHTLPHKLFSLHLYHMCIHCKVMTYTYSNKLFYDIRTLPLGHCSPVDGR